MISRIADHCFWFGRYLERAESAARVLHVMGNLALDAELSPSECWRPVLVVAGEEERFKRSLGEDAAHSGERVQHYMTFSEENPVSVRSSVALARENARAIRDVVSLEVWHTINELYLWLNGNGAPIGFGAGSALATYKENRYGFYRSVRQHVELALGLLMSTMLHDSPLDFILLGVYLERAVQTARTLDMHHFMRSSLPVTHPVVETALWLSLLRSCSGFEPFMKRSQGRVTAEAVAAFVMLEPRFPRSVRYCLQSAGERLDDIRSPSGPGVPGEGAQIRLRLLEEWLVDLPVASLKGEAVHEALLRVIDEASGVCEAVGRELLGRPSAQSGTVA